MVLLAVAAGGCGPQQRERVYLAEACGLRFVPPEGWSERARGDDAPGGAARERLLVQYKRLQAGRPAWLRVSVADSLPGASPAACLAGRAPGRDWRKGSAVQPLEISGHPAARVAYAGHWNKQSLVSETVAVRQGDRVYYFTGTFPDGDDAAREQVRQAVAGATWQAPLAVAGR
jgi:hypothetical protein